MSSYFRVKLVKLYCTSNNFILTKHFDCVIFINVIIITQRYQLMKIIATIQNEFNSKFGIPRQSGLIETESKIIFTPQYRDPDAIRGLEGFSHLWLIWEFSESKTDKWKPTVRPPRLGGNKRIGVFATRSPFRPNPIGLSCVKIQSIEINTQMGPIITVTGADLMNGTPIYDIKPYIPFSDSYPDAKGGFAEENFDKKLTVFFNEESEKNISKHEKEILTKILEQDPRPAYQNEQVRDYSFEYGNLHINFTVKGNTLTVNSIIRQYT